MQQDLFDLLSLNAGVRYEHNSVFGGEWIPQAGFTVRPFEGNVIKGSLSKGFRSPNIREMYMFPPQNPDLRPESMMSYEVSVGQDFLDGDLTAELTAFFIDGKDLIQTTRVDGRPLNVNSGRIKNWGVEADAAWRIGPHWRADANYSWTHMENPVLSAPQHKLYVGAGFRQGRWTVSTGLQYVKGLYTALATETAPAATEDFVLWNLRASFRLCPYASLFVRGENLLGQHYEIMAGYPMPKATFLGGIRIGI